MRTENVCRCNIACGLWIYDILCSIYPGKKLFCSHRKNPEKVRVYNSRRCSQPRRGVVLIKSLTVSLYLLVFKFKE